MGAVEQMMCVMYVGITREHSGDGCELVSNLRKYDLIKGDLLFELGKDATSEAGKFLFWAANVWWRCSQHFVIGSCGYVSRVVNAGRGCKGQPYGGGILQNRSHDGFIDREP